MSDRRKHRILCISRSTSHLRTILSHLSHEEFEGVAASSPEEAVAFCTANQVTAIVLDSEFVTEGGWTVAQSFRMVAPQLPIVLVRTNHDHEVPVGIDAVAAGVDLVLGTLKTLLANSTSNGHDSTVTQPNPAPKRQLNASNGAIGTPQDHGKTSDS